MSVSSQAHDVYAVEQLLAREGFRRTVAEPSGLHLIDPARIDVAGDEAWVTYYARTHGCTSNELERLAYGHLRVERGTEGWAIAEVEELPTGDPAGPALLVRGVRTGRDVPAPPVAEDAALQLVLDEQAIRNVLATYGAAADGGAAELVGELYTADAHVDIEGDMFLHGSAGVAAMILGDDHQRLLPWAAHTMGPALVVVDGDRATSTHYGRTYGRTTGRTSSARPNERTLWRFSVNRWELQRGADGRWRIDRRTSRSPAHPEMPTLLARVLAEHLAVSINRRAALPGGGDLAAAIEARDLVTATVLRAQAGAADLLESVADARIDWDGTEVRGAASLLAGAAGDDVIAHLPGPGAVTVDGDAATVVQPLLTYRQSGRAHVEMARQAVGEWRLRRARERGWHVSDVRFRSAHRRDAVDLLAAALGG